MESESQYQCGSCMSAYNYNIYCCAWCAIQEYNEPIYLDEMYSAAVDAGIIFC